MKYSELRLMMNQKPYFTSKDLSGTGVLNKTLKLQLSQWVKKGKIIKLKKGFYTLNDLDRQFVLSAYLLANELYSPSYVSMEFALSHYQLIPEAVNTFTSITTNKTKSFENNFGKFVYRSMKKEYFFGFKKMKSPDNHYYFIATPEKALIDFIYYKITSKTTDIKSVLLENYRFQNFDMLDIKILKDYSKRINNKLVFTVLETVKELISEWS